MIFDLNPDSISLSNVGWCVMCWLKKVRTLHHRSSRARIRRKERKWCKHSSNSNRLLLLRSTADRSRSRSQPASAALRRVVTLAASAGARIDTRNMRAVNVFIRGTARGHRSKVRPSQTQVIASPPHAPSAVLGRLRSDQGRDSIQQTHCTGLLCPSRDILTKTHKQQPQK